MLLKMLLKESLDLNVLELNLDKNHMLMQLMHTQICLMHVQAVTQS